MRKVQIAFLVIVLFAAVLISPAPTGTAAVKSEDYIEQVYLTADCEGMATMAEVYSFLSFVYILGFPENPIFFTDWDHVEEVYNAGYGFFRVAVLGNFFEITWRGIGVDAFWLAKYKWLRACWKPDDGSGDWGCSTPVPQVCRAYALPVVFK